MPDQDAAAGTQATQGATSPERGAAAPGQETAEPGSQEVAMEERAALEQSARGMAVRRQVLGDAHVDRATAAADAFTAPFQDLITRYAWGEVWTRPGLTRPERSMITLTALACLRQEEELAMHVRAALRNGLSPEQIREVLLQVAIYAGVPAANRAFAIAQRVLADAAPTGPAGETGQATSAGPAGETR